MDSPWVCCFRWFTLIYLTTLVCSAAIWGGRSSTWCQAHSWLVVSTHQKSGEWNKKLFLYKFKTSWKSKFCCWNLHFYGNTKPSSRCAVRAFPPWHQEIFTWDIYGSGLYQLASPDMHNTCMCIYLYICNYIYLYGHYVYCIYCVYHYIYIYITVYIYYTILKSCTYKCVCIILNICHMCMHVPRTHKIIPRVP